MPLCQFFAKGNLTEVDGRIKGAVWRLAIIDWEAKEGSQSDDKYIQKVKMNAYPDRVRAVFIYGKMSKAVTYVTVYTN